VSDPDAAGRRPRARAAVAIGLACALAIPAPAAWAYWSTTNTVSTTLNAASLATPVATCQSMTPSGQTPYARVSWAAVAGATSYTVTVRNAANTTSATLAASTTATSIDVNAGLLGGLVGTLLTLLLGGQSLYVVVRANHTSGWTSELSAGTPVRLAGNVVQGLLGGLRCGP
jgi:hypothetical protein